MHLTVRTVAVFSSSRGASRARPMAGSQLPLSIAIDPDGKLYAARTTSRAARAEREDGDKPAPSGPRRKNANVSFVAPIVTGARPPSRGGWVNRLGPGC